MKKTRPTLAWALGGLGLSSPLSAAITLYSSDFSQTSGANGIDGWVYNGGVGGGAARSTTAFDNYDLAALVGDGSGPYAGDGVKGDGALRGDTGDAVAGNEFWSYPLSGVFGVGDSLNFSGTGFNANSSHNDFHAILFDTTANVELARSGTLGGARQGLVGDDVNPMYPFSVSYTLTATQSGHTMEIRFLENHNNASRDVFVDNASVTLTLAPEPTKAVFGGFGLFGFLICYRRRLED